MSQTWVIKDTAPVDEASRVLPKINASFTTANGLEFGEAIEVVTDGSVCSLLYYLIQLGIKVTVAAADMDLSTETEFFWSSKSRKTLVFDTDPTGALLSWLQKNAILKTPGMNYQDIHLEDKAIWNQLQTAWEQGDYTAALNVLKNANLSDKQLNAAAINALTTELLSLQAQSDPSFKTGQIVVASEPPSDLAVGKVYFRLIGPVTDYNKQNAYYIEINQKTSSGYDVLNPATQADNIALTENTAAKFGLVGVTYTLDKALYDVEQLLQVVTTT